MHSHGRDPRGTSGIVARADLTPQLEILHSLRDISFAIQLRYEMDHVGSPEGQVIESG